MPRSSWKVEQYLPTGFRSGTPDASIRREIDAIPGIAMPSRDQRLWTWHLVRAGKFPAAPAASYFARLHKGLPWSAQNGFSMQFSGQYGRALSVQQPRASKAMSKRVKETEAS